MRPHPKLGPDAYCRFKNIADGAGRVLDIAVSIVRMSQLYFMNDDPKPDAAYALDQYHENGASKAVSESSRGTRGHRVPAEEFYRNALIGLLVDYHSYELTLS